MKRLKWILRDVQNRDADTGWQLISKRKFSEIWRKRKDKGKKRRKWERAKNLPKFYLHPHPHPHFHQNWDQKVTQVVNSTWRYTHRFAVSKTKYWNSSPKEIESIRSGQGLRKQREETRKIWKIRKAREIKSKGCLF